MLKFSCEKTLLQQAVSTVSRAVAAKSSIPALEGVLLEGDTQLTLSGYNMQTGIRTAISAEIHQEGRIVLNARLFGEMIRRLPDDIVVFSADEKYVVKLVCGDASFELPGLSADDYPELPTVDDEFSVSIQQNTMKAMINQTSFAVSTNEARPIHTGALFEISDTGLTMVEKICADTDALLTVVQGKRHLMFEAENTQLICRRLEGEFLDYRNAIPKNNPICVEVETKALLESLDRVSVVISEKLKSPVRCLFDADRVYLSARTGNGEAKDICPISGDGQQLEIGFNNRYLMDALRYAPADKVKMQLNTGISPCIITPVDGGDEFLYMVLPVRLKAQ